MHVMGNIFRHEFGVLVNIFRSRTAFVGLGQNKNVFFFWTTMELYSTEESNVSGFGYTDNT